MGYLSVSDPAREVRIDFTYCPFYGKCRQGRACIRALNDRVQAVFKSIDALMSVFAEPPGCFEKKNKTGVKNGNTK